MVRKKVAIVDDDAIALSPYLMELETSGIDVTQFYNADDCYEFALSNDVDLYVIDVMLATRQEGQSKFNRNNTMNFLLTGCVLAREIRSHCVSTPIIFFSATSRTELLKEIQKQAESIGNCAFLSKSNMEELFDFRDIVQAVLENGLNATSKRDWFDWVYKALLLQPNIAGLGVDIKVIVGGPGKCLK